VRVSSPLIETLTFYWLGKVAFWDALFYVTAQFVGDCRIEMPPDCFPHGVEMIPTTVNPTADPISARRPMALGTNWRTGEAECCNNVANAQIENMYRPSSHASIKYCCQ
jgi:hypothetical protein